MSNNKQSSVEWLIEQVINNNGVNKSTFEQAKAMHKEEIIDACERFTSMFDGDVDNFKEYYNETYGGNND